jgi:hypothetical protein
MNINIPAGHVVLIYQDPKAVIAAIADPTTDKIVESLCDFFNYDRGVMVYDVEYVTGRSYRFNLWDSEDANNILFDSIIIQTTQLIQ